MLEDTLKEPLAVTVNASSTLKLSGVDDITGQYVRHGFYNGRPSYKHATLGDVYLLFDGTAWTFSTDRAGHESNHWQIFGAGCKCARVHVCNPRLLKAVRNVQFCERQLHSS